MRKTRVCNLVDIPSNGMKAYELEGNPKILVVNSGERYYAYQAQCPHQEVCLDEGIYDGETLTCHQHLWQWDITNGHALGLAEAPLQSFPLIVENDVIFVLQPSALEAAELLSGISVDAREKLEQVVRREEYPDGHTLYEVGDPADDIYILESGRVEFFIGRDNQITGAGFVLHKGEIFGWGALLNDHPRRLAKAACLENSVVLRLNGQETLKIFESEPLSGYTVMRKLSTLISRYLTFAS